MLGRKTTFRRASRLVKQNFYKTFMPFPPLLSRFFFETNTRLTYFIEIIEIGWALLSVHERSILKSGSILVKPTVSTVSSFCTQLTSLTPDQLSTSGLSFPDALRNLRETFGSNNNNIPWASWGEWDRKMFRSQCEKFGEEYPFKTGEEDYIDIKTEFILRKGLSKTVGLEEAVRLVGREMVGQHHRGVDDATNAALVLSDIWNPSEGKGKEEKKESKDWK